MPRGSKSSYTAKQKRQAGHIEERYEKRGVKKKTAEARAWATVNKTTGGGKKKTKKSATKKKSSAAKTKRGGSVTKKKTRSRPKKSK